MTRLTITLNNSIHAALKETAARQGKSIGAIIEESLILRGIKSMDSARELVAKARGKARLSEKAAMDLAIEATRSVRRK